jgi:acetyl esterase/lipase
MKRRTLGLLALCACGSPSPDLAKDAPSACEELAQRVADSELAIRSNVAYGTDHAEQRGDVYLPPGAGPFPALLLVHGGGFFGGDKALLADAARYYAARGIVTFNINYFLAKTDGSDPAYPRAMQDVYCAIRFMRANAAAAKLDKTRIAIMGSSAGAGIAAMIGLGGAAAPYNGGCQQNGESVSVAAVIDYFGPADFRGDIGTEAFLTLFGTDGTAQQQIDASPLLKASSSAPPFLITHGTADTAVPFSQSEALNQALLAAGTDVAFVPIADAGHGFVNPWNGGDNLRARCHVDELLARTLAP